jgi:hypothetical protein
MTGQGRISVPTTKQCSSKRSSWRQEYRGARALARAFCGAGIMNFSAARALSTRWLGRRRRDDEDQTAGPVCPAARIAARLADRNGADAPRPRPATGTSSRSVGPCPRRQQMATANRRPRRKPGTKSQKSTIHPGQRRKRRTLRRQKARAHPSRSRRKRLNLQTRRQQPKTRRRWPPAWPICGRLVPVSNPPPSSTTTAAAASQPRSRSRRSCPMWRSSRRRHFAAKRRCSLQE